MQATVRQAVRWLFITHYNLWKKPLAINIVKELGLICPIKSNRSTTVQNGMLAFNGSGYGEIRSPYQHGLIPVLAETDFHDNPNTFKVDNRQQRCYH